MKKFIKKIFVGAMALTLMCGAISGNVYAEESEDAKGKNPLFTVIVDKTGKFEEPQMIATMKDCTERGIPYICIQKDLEYLTRSEAFETMKKGDIDGNGKINLQDTTLALKGVLGIEELTEEQLEQLNLYSSETKEAGLYEVGELSKAALGFRMSDSSISHPLLEL